MINLKVLAVWQKNIWSVKYFKQGLILNWYQKKIDAALLDAVPVSPLADLDNSCQKYLLVRILYASPMILYYKAGSCSNLLVNEL